jgi:hypothetical protein
MQRRAKTAILALGSALLLIAAVAGLAEKGDAAQQAAPSNQSPPVVSGTAEEGKTLTTSNGSWNGTAPLSFTYSWRRCDADGGSCAQIGGANQSTYVLKKVDGGNTIRSRVTARNSDGSSSATSVPTAVVRAAAPAPSGCAGNAPIQIASVSPPERLLVDGQSISPSVVGRSSQTVTIRAHVSCGGKAVQGALVLAEAVPFNQYTRPAEATTGADGWAQLTMTQLSGFPAASRQQLLVVFFRARKSGENILGGVSTRRLVSFPVDLRR